jgi:hypothetical protein
MSRTVRAIDGASVAGGRADRTTMCIVGGEIATQVPGEPVASWSTSRYTWVPGG